MTFATVCTSLIAVTLFLQGCRPDEPRVAQVPACAICEIRYERIATIGRVEDPWSIQSRIGVRILKRTHGEYLVFEVLRPTLARYTREGAYLGAIGAVGSGPGEFRAIRAVAVDAEDSVHVFDERLRTMSTFSPTLEHVRTVRFPHAVIWFVPVHGGYVTHGYETDSVRGRHRLHLISRDGEYLRGYDSPGEYHGRTLGSSGSSRAGQLGGSRLYIIEQAPPRVTVHHAATGQMERVVEIRPPWYPGPTVETKRYVPDSPELMPREIPQRPARSVMEIATHEDGWVVTLGWIEAPGWDNVDPPFGAVPPTGAVQQRMERYWVGRVDIYDPNSFQFMSGIDIPFFARTLLANGEFVSLAEREDGLIVLEVYRLFVGNARSEK